MTSAFPTNLLLQWSPTASIWADPASVTDWQSIPNVRSLTYGRGVKRRPGKVEAGTLLAVFGDPSRTYDPNRKSSPQYGTFISGRLIRVVLEGYTDFVGYITDVLPDWTMNDFQITLVASDRLGLLAQAPKYGSVLQQQLTNTNPDFWFPLTDAPLGMGAQEWKGRASGAVYGNPGSAPGGLYEPQPGVSLGQATGGYILLTGVPTPSPPYTIGFVLNVLKLPSAGTGINDLIEFGANRTAPPYSGYDTSAWLGASGTVNFRVGDGGVSAYDFTSVGVQGQIVLVFLQYSTAGLVVRVQGVQSSVASRNFGAIQGAAVIGGGVLNQSSPSFGMQHYCIWNRVLTVAEMQGLEAAFSAPWIGQTADSRISSLLGVTGSTAPTNLDAGTVAMGPEAFLPNLLDSFDRAAQTEQGIFLADGKGAFRFLNRTHLGPVRGVYDTNPDPTTTNQPLSDLKMTHDNTTFYTKATVKAGSVAPWTWSYDHPNESTLGVVEFKEDTNFNTPADAMAAAIAIVGSATPHNEVSEADVTLADFSVLAQTEVGDAIQIVARPPDGTGDSGGRWGSTFQYGTGPGWCGPADPILATEKVLSFERTFDGVNLTHTTKYSTRPVS